jgi:hypothetical protein
MKRSLASVLAVLVVAGFPALAAAEDAPHVQPVTDFAVAKIKPWLSDPAVVDAVKAANEKHKTIDYMEIVELDEGWKDKSKTDLIEATMNNPLSEFLKARRAEVGEAMIEAFVMDDKGLNVGQTDGTSDYFQADEAKWQKTYPVGPDAIFVDEVEEEDGKKIAQVSLSVSDGGKAIGAITVAVDVDKLN